MINLHNHTHQGSILDSILKINEMVTFAKNNNQSAIAITEHGTMFSYVDFYKACKKNNIKPIIGVEIYEVESDTTEKRYHLILLAKNNIGVKNIMKIVTRSADNFYYKHIISIDEIRENNLGEGIICLSGCLGGRLIKGLNENKDMLPYYNSLEQTFDDVFVEFQAHNTEEQYKANKQLTEFAKRYNKKIVVTADAHMLNKEDEYAHEIFVKINANRDTDDFYTDCFLQNDEDVYNILKDNLDKNIIQEAIDNTHVIADMIEDYDIGITKVPQMPHIDNNMNEEEFLNYVSAKMKDKCVKYNKDNQEYQNRLKTEVPVLHKLKYTDYFLVVNDIIKLLRNKNIPLGYGRGSVGGSLTAFAMDISDVDSIKWNLDFTRFANLGRNDMADIDIDVSRNQRDFAIELIKQKYGEENVAMMSTFGTFTTKVAIRDIGKILNDDKDSPYFGMIDSKLRLEVASYIPSIKSLTDNGELEERELALSVIIDKSEPLKAFKQSFPIWFDLVAKLEGLVKTHGKHASGILIAPKPITEYTAIQYTSTGKVCCLEMHNAMDDLGLIKIDLLGLRNLDVVDDTLKLCGKTWEDIDVNRIDLNDKNVFNVFNSLNTKGVFQCESLEAIRIINEIGVDSIDDIVALLALNRPGTSSFSHTYGHNKKSGCKSDEIQKDLSYIFEKTFGILLYQEQALQIFRHNGFPETEVDIARKCLHKDSLVSLSNGICKPIKDVEIGDEVISINIESGKIEYKKVTNKWNNGIKKTKEVVFENGYKVVATGDHKIFAENNWTEINNLKVGDCGYTTKHNKHYKDELKSNKRLDSEICYAIGLLIGDGTLNNGAIIFTNSEIEVINQYIKAIKKMRIKDLDFKILSVKGKSVENIYTVYPIKGAIHLKNFLKKMDLCHHSDKKTIPSEILKLQDSNSLRSVIAGLFNTDGYILNQSNTIEYSTKSQKLSLDLKQALLKIGIYSTISKKYIKNYDYYMYTLRIKHIDSLKIFKEKICPLIVGRKRNEYESVIKNRIETKNTFDYTLSVFHSQEIKNAVLNSNDSFQSLFGTMEFKQGLRTTDEKAKKIAQSLYCPQTYKLLMSDMIPIQVTEINESEESEVYDIEVEGNHNFIVDGVLVHNCIGKKDPILMKSLKTKFSENALFQQWSQDDIEKVWGLMEKQASYS